MTAPKSPSAARSGERPEPAPEGALRAARLLAFDADTRTARIALGSREVDALLDDTLSPRVLATALARGERLIATNEGGSWVVLGALRTAPTPGVDEGDDIVIKARRLSLHADNELALTTGAASFVLRAAGFVETVAQDITTRASGIHKLVGRLIRLN